MKRTLSILVAVSVVCAASFAPAAMMEYQLRIDGVVAPTHNLAPGVYDMAVEVRVVDNELAPGVHGGLLQAAINVSEPSGVNLIEPVRPPAGGFPPAVPELWDASFAEGLNLSSRGLTDFEEYDIFAHTMAFPPGDFGSNFGKYGAGEWSELSVGQIEYLGGATALELTAADGNKGQLVFRETGGGQFGAGNPHDVGVYRTEFVPEPSSLILLVLGLVGFIARRR